MSSRYKKMVLSGVIMALVVVTLGAYTRLSDAGLGCPDWPGCYGFLTVPKQQHEIQSAQALFPDATIEQGKAWTEMIHRYFAGALGLIILALAIYSLRLVKHKKVPMKLPMAMLVLVIFQALLGMWTVTMNLQPLIVMGHLLGGFTITSLMWLLYLRLQSYHLSPPVPEQRSTFGWTVAALVMIVVQIALGGWLAANYSASHCTGFPLCAGSEAFSLSSVFQLPHSESSYEYGVLPFEARMSIHLLHRIGALVSVCVLAVCMYRVISQAQAQKIKTAAWLVLLVLAVQITLGVVLVHLAIPLFIALAHNFVALVLLLSLIRLAFLQKQFSKGAQS